MEFLTPILEAIGTFGFPIVCCLVLGWFVFKIYKDTTKQNAENMEKVQARCKEREEKLYQEMEKQNEINNKAIDTIAHYAEKLDSIQQDIKDIKTDITVIMAKQD